MGTEVWQIEGVAIGDPDMVADSLADRTISAQAGTAAIKVVTDNLPDSGSLTDLAAIEAVTSNLPNSGALTDISSETDKIDGAATDGLVGTVDSLAYRVHEIETHLHANERWFGAANVPNGEVHVADRIGTTTTAFQNDAGNDTWSAWSLIVGSSDTPADAGMAFNDLQRFSVVSVENANATHFVQISFGATGAAGLAALAAGDYTEFAFRPQSVQGAEAFLTIQSCRHAAGTKIWLRHWTVGQNTSTMDFFVGLHEYEG